MPEEKAFHFESYNHNGRVIFKPGNTFRGFTFCFLQKLEPQQLLLVSCMTGLRYFLTNGLYPCNCWGQTRAHVAIQALAD